MGNVKSNTGRYLRELIDNIDYMITGKEGTMLSRTAEKYGGVDEVKTMMQPQEVRDYAYDFFHGEKGKITGARKKLDGLKSGLDGLQGDKLKQRQQQIADAEKEISGLNDDYDKALSGEYKGEGYKKGFQGKKGRLVDIYGPKNAMNFVDFMNAGTKEQVATKYGMLGAAYFGASGAVRGLSGGGVTYNASGERDIMGVPFF